MQMFFSFRSSKRIHYCFETFNIVCRNIKDIFFQCTNILFFYFARITYNCCYVMPAI